MKHTFQRDTFAQRAAEMEREQCKLAEDPVLRQRTVRFRH